MDEPALFENFYTSKLEPELPRLRKEATMADAWKFTGVLVFILGVLALFGYYAEMLSGPSSAWLIVLFAVILIVSVYMYSRRKDQFTDDFKAVLIRAVIDEVCPGLVYKPGETISGRDYKTSSLYRYRYDYFDGDDLIEGRINNVPFHCAELHIQSDYAGNRQINVFKGLFFVIGINPRFNGGTYLWPRHSAQLATSMMDEEYRLLPMPHVTDVHFGDPEFAQHFRVCSTIPYQAMEILTPEMRGRILGIARAMKMPLSISFAAGRCFIGVPVYDDLLEPTDYDPGDKEEIRKYFVTVRLIVNMVRQMGLEVLQ